MHRLGVGHGETAASDTPDFILAAAYDRDLANIVAAWPTLPVEVRQTIARLVKGAIEEERQGNAPKTNTDGHG
jgi:hypothetical protein